MKKFMMFVLIAFVAAGVTAFANYETGRACKATKPMMTSVSEALKMNEDTIVTLRGNIVDKISEDKYTFKDSTGTMMVDIDNDKWAGISQDTKDMLELSGEIDREAGTVELDVDSIKKVSN